MTIRVNIVSQNSWRDQSNMKTKLVTELCGNFFIPLTLSWDYHTIRRDQKLNRGQRTMRSCTSRLEPSYHSIVTLSALDVSKYLLEFSIRNSPTIDLRFSRQLSCVHRVSFVPLSKEQIVQLCCTIFFGRHFSHTHCALFRCFRVPR